MAQSIGSEGGDDLELKRKDAGLNDEMYGYFPKTALLANPYVPCQRNGAKQYCAKRGLIRGTLFPGLDLPFKGMVNTKEKADTPENELMALRFAITELGEYLDTHPGDEEALELMQSYIALYRTGKEKYEKLYGPLSCMSAPKNGGYGWLKGPWPWEYRENGEV